MLAIQYLKVLGGMDNLQAMSVCLTRLSLRVRDISLVDQSRLLGLGCLSWIQLNDHQLVLVLGPNASLIEGQIRMLAGASRCRSVSSPIRSPPARAAGSLRQTATARPQSPSGCAGRAPGAPGSGR